MADNLLGDELEDGEIPASPTRNDLHRGPSHLDKTRTSFPLEHDSFPCRTKMTSDKENSRVHLPALDSKGKDNVHLRLGEKEELDVKVTNKSRKPRPTIISRLGKKDQPVIKENVLLKHKCMSVVSRFFIKNSNESCKELSDSRQITESGEGNIVIMVGGQPTIPTRVKTKKGILTKRILKMIAKKTKVHRPEPNMGKVGSDCAINTFHLIKLKEACNRLKDSHRRQAAPDNAYAPISSSSDNLSVSTTVPSHVPSTNPIDGSSVNMVVYGNSVNCKRSNKSPKKDEISVSMTVPAENNSSSKLHVCSAHSPRSNDMIDPKFVENAMLESKIDTASIVKVRREDQEGCEVVIGCFGTESVENIILSDDDQLKMDCSVMEKADEIELNSTNRPLNLGIGVLFNDEVQQIKENVKDSQISHKTVACLSSALVKIDETDACDKKPENDCLSTAALVDVPMELPCDETYDNRPWSTSIIEKPRNVNNAKDPAADKEDIVTGVATPRNILKSVPDSKGVLDVNFSQIQSSSLLCSRPPIKPCSVLLRRLSIGASRKLKPIITKTKVCSVRLRRLSSSFMKKYIKEKEFHQLLVPIDKPIVSLLLKSDQLKKPVPTETHLSPLPTKINASIAENKPSASIIPDTLSSSTVDNKPSTSNIPVNTTNITVNSSTVGHYPTASKILSSSSKAGRKPITSNSPVISSKAGIKLSTPNIPISSSKTDNKSSSSNICGISSPEKMKFISNYKIPKRVPILVPLDGVHERVSECSEFPIVPLNRPGSVEPTHTNQTNKSSPKKLDILSAVPLTVTISQTTAPRDVLIAQTHPEKLVPHVSSETLLSTHSTPPAKAESCDIVVTIPEKKLSDALVDTAAPTPKPPHYEQAETDQPWGAPRESFDFVSTNFLENADNFDKRWANMRNASDEVELYRIIRERWRNVSIPNPSKNLTYRQCWRRRIQSQKNKNFQHIHSTRRRTQSCTDIFERKLLQLRLEANRALDELVTKQSNELNQINSSFTDDIQFNHRIIPQDYSRQRSYSLDECQLREAHEMERERLCRWHNIQIGKYTTYMNEISTFYNFYKRLDPANDRGIAMLSEEQIQQIEHTENMFEAFKTIYHTN